MKILVIGNIASGKSYLIDNISNNNINEFRIIRIDNYRKRYGDGSFSKEYLSWSYFLESIESKNSAIIEFTGAGAHKHVVRQALINSVHKILVVYLSTDLSICISRGRNRILDIPYPWKINPINVMHNIHDELEKDWKNNFWSIFNTLKSADGNRINKYIEGIIND